MCASGARYREHCLTMALEVGNDADGFEVFGGLSPNQRRHLRRRAEGRTPARTARAYLAGEIVLPGKVAARRNRKLDQAASAEVMAAYRAGATHLELAHRYGCSPSVIGRVLDAAAGRHAVRPMVVAPRPRSPQLDPATRAEIVALYHRGVP